MEIADRIRPSNFFRSRLLTLTDPDEITDLIRSMAAEQDDMRQMIARMMWHMRGGLSRQEAWTLSPAEQRDVIALIQEHKELTEKTGLPLL